MENESEIKAIANAFIRIAAELSDLADRLHRLADGKINGCLCYNLGFECKVYLRPMSSMTEEEEEEYDTFFNTDYGYMDASKVFDVSDWMYAHHFDYRGLIPMGLALEAPEGMY